MPLESHGPFLHSFIELGGALSHLAVVSTQGLFKNNIEQQMPLPEPSDHGGLSSLCDGNSSLS